MDIQQKISGRILVLFKEHFNATNGRDQTASLKFAVNKVLGVAAFECLAAEIYDELRAKAA